MVSVGVVVGTYGDKDTWEPLAQRAVDSAVNQTRVPDVIVWNHSDTLAQARNHGAVAVGTDQLIFLDADDTLDEGYVQAMLDHLEYTSEYYGGGWGIFRPSTLGVYGDGTTDAEPAMIPAGDLRHGNYIVVGAMCDSWLFHEVGGFDEYPILEDWALWRKMVSRGAWVVEVADAVYRVGVREGSRNTDHALHNEVYRRILREVPL